MARKFNEAWREKTGADSVLRDFKQALTFYHLIISADSIPFSGTGCWLFTTSCYVRCGPTSCAGSPGDEQGQELRQELREYRTTALFLFAQDLALSGVVIQIVRYGYGSNYPGNLIDVAAFHAFYSLTLAIINIVRYRRFHSPVLSAAKAVTLTTALVSMLTWKRRCWPSLGRVMNISACP